MTILAQSLSLRRTASLTRWNTVLLSRNRLAFFYAAVMPLLPLGLLMTGERGSETVGAIAVTIMFSVTALFPVYYNVLAQFVSRRDELVRGPERSDGGQEDDRHARQLGGLGVLGPCGGPVGEGGEHRDRQRCRRRVEHGVYRQGLAERGAIGMAIALRASAVSTPGSAMLASSSPSRDSPVRMRLSTLPNLPDWLSGTLSRTPGAAMSDLIRTGWLGLDGPDAKEATLTFAETSSQAAAPLLVMAAWTFLAVMLARRSMRWEPRTWPRTIVHQRAPTARDRLHARVGPSRTLATRDESVPPRKWRPAGRTASGTGSGETALASVHTVVSSLIFLPSPLLGPSVWRPVARIVADQGWHTTICTVPAPVLRSEDVLDAFLAALPAERDVVLVPHSNAGAYVPELAMQRPVVAAVFVDAILPAPSGRIPLAPPEFLDILRAKADDDGLLPPWTSWWDEADMAALFPNAESRAGVEQEQQRLPLSYFTEAVAVPQGWDKRPGAYVAFSDTYAADRDAAARRGWPVRTLSAGHLHQLCDPDQVADTLLALLGQIVPDAR